MPSIENRCDVRSEMLLVVVNGDRAAFTCPRWLTPSTWSGGIHFPQSSFHCRSWCHMSSSTSDRFVCYVTVLCRREVKSNLRPLRTMFLDIIHKVWFVILYHNFYTLSYRYFAMLDNCTILTVCWIWIFLNARAEAWNRAMHNLWL